jgi:hypothetical protein
MRNSVVASYNLASPIIKPPPTRGSPLSSGESNRVLEDLKTRLRADVRGAVSEAPSGVIESVSVYGSIVRGDFWLKQSDVDLLVETGTYPADSLATSFEADPAPKLPSLISRVCSVPAPSWGGLQTRWV